MNPGSISILGWAFAVFITLLVLYGFVYYGNYRYRLPYEPLMMVVAAMVVDRGWRGLRAARDADAASVADGVESDTPVVNP